MQKFENTLWSENVQSGKCLSGEMPSGGSILRGSVRLGNCPFGEMSVGEVSVGEVSLGDLSSGSVSWGTVQSGNCPTIRFFEVQNKVIKLKFFRRLCYGLCFQLFRQSQVCICAELLLTLNCRGSSFV